MKSSPPKQNPLPTSSSALWRPSWAWHLKALGILYVLLLVVFFVVDRWLGNLPAPYGLREIPPEMTPWIKK